MEQKNRLFDFLYQSLREQIETGLLPYGSALPSMSQLCEIYHVGMRTVREVLKALAKEGLIQTAERKPPASYTALRGTTLLRNRPCAQSGSTETLSCLCMRP